ncbi:GDSL-type esterase/lipase family protein [Schlesneria paludicola]|uniref:GDSL-type esterase/lipase family protein n=1 Tax=Schlesneria paludicola TaxID=360056 RepID=UPI00029B1AA8|nr:GDSL-type esterase/lipase family protein [Schlesneria paludicola]
MKQINLVSLLLAATVLLLGLAPAGAFAQEKSVGLELPATDDGLPGAGPIRRYDWFQNVWKERHEVWSKRVDQDQKSLVFLGDSITQGWGDDLGGSFKGVKVANRGIGGDTTRGMLIRLQTDVLALKPTGVVLLMGTNDLEENAEPEVIAGNLKLILAALKKYDPKLPVILCQVFPSSETAKRPAEKIKALNKLYAAAVKGDAQVTLLETWPLFADEQGNAKVAEFPDLLHPNAAGYAKWAAALKPILATLNYLETTDDDFQPEAGFESLFNGKDFTGWDFRDQKTMEHQAAFDGQVTTTDGRYIAKHGRVVVSTPAEGRRVQQLWTKREFSKDFVLKLEFRATPNADSGVFIRKPQLQCRDYPLAGPYKTLKHYRAQDWNELVVVVKNNVARCTCNDEVLEEALTLPASGPIGLEGDSGQMEYRRIRIKETP